MSTHALIGLRCADNSIKFTYVQYDGYPEYQEPILHKSYNSYDKVLSLISKGFMRSTHEELEKCDVFEDEANRVENSSDLQDFLVNQDYGAAWKYLFQDERWFYCSCNEKEIMKVLPEDFTTITIYDE